MDKPEITTAKSPTATGAPQSDGHVQPVSAGKETGKEQSPPPTSVPQPSGASKSATKKDQPLGHHGGLVVSQNGKIVYQEGANKETSSAEKKGGPASTQVPDKDPASENVALVAPTHRVEPKYPEAARQGHLQGPVKLKVMVGKNGGVEQVQVLSGDAILAAAASDAIVQWRFAPLSRAGQPVEFQTEVTVNFKLPQ